MDLVHSTGGVGKEPTITQKTAESGDSNAKTRGQNSPGNNRGQNSRRNSLKKEGGNHASSGRGSRRKSSGNHGRSGRSARKKKDRRHRQPERNPTYSGNEEILHDLDNVNENLDAKVADVSARFGFGYHDQLELRRRLDLKVWSNPTRVPKKRGQKAFFFTVAKNCAIDMIREWEGIVLVDFQACLIGESEHTLVATTILNWSIDGREKVDRYIRARMVWEALAVLSEEDELGAHALVLNEMMDVSLRDFRDNGIDLGKTRAAVVVQRAKRRFKEIYLELLGEEEQEKENKAD